MGQRPFIVLGDSTDHGGVVVGASQVTFTHEKPIARVGDQVTCPKKGHGTTVIVTGDPTMIIDGRPAARHGDKCACGATLIASQFVSTTSDGGGGSGHSHAHEASPASHLANTTRPPVEFSWDEQVRLVITNGTATMTGLPWLARTTDGRTLSGRLDEEGQLPRIDTDHQEDYEIFWGDEAIAMMAAQDQP
jgi:uncharacterized Zn-binding protein involved in type VI secretion